MDSNNTTSTVNVGDIAIWYSANGIESIGMVRKVLYRELVVLRLDVRSMLNDETVKIFEKSALNIIRGNPLWAGMKPKDAWRSIQRREDDSSRQSNHNMRRCINQ